MPVIPKMIAGETEEKGEKSVKESPEVRIARIMANPVDFSCAADFPKGGKGSNNLFLKVSSGEDELVSVNMGIPNADPVAHNNLEAALCRRIAAALLANAGQCDEVNAQIKAHHQAQAFKKVSKIRAALEKAQDSKARRDVIKGFGLHTPEMEPIPNGKKFDEAVEAMLVQMVTFEE